MAVRIRITGSGDVSIRIDAVSRIDVGTASSGVRLLVDDDAGDALSVYTRAPRGTGRGERSRRTGTGLVTPAMEAAAIEAFLAGADTARLGRSLADVYRAMDAVRRRQDALDDEDGS